VLHCDDEDLSLTALGEPMGREDEAHLSTCPRCQSRVDQLAAVVASARAITDQDRPLAPPPELWQSITDELGMSSGGNVTSIADARRARRPRIWPIAIAAVALGVVAGGVITAGLLAPPTGHAILAQGQLDPMADSGFTGTATVEEGPDGAVLTVAVPDLPGVDDGYYEVWMATADAGTMVAIGTLNPGQQGQYPLPAGMDVNAFPVVDVSVEHFDGDAGHSAISVVRGQLQA
jgi:hypothetical protein